MLCAKEITGWSLESSLTLKVSFRKTVSLIRRPQIQEFKEHILVGNLIYHLECCPSKYCIRIKILYRMECTDNEQNKRLGRECQRLEISMNICRPDVSHLTNLNVRRLRTSAIPKAPLVVPPRSIFALLDRLSGEEIPDFRFRSPNVVVTHIWTNISSELNADQGEGILRPA